MHFALVTVRLYTPRGIQLVNQLF